MFITILVSNIGGAIIIAMTSCNIIIMCEIGALIIFQGSSLVLIICMLISILTGVSTLIVVYPNSGTDNGLHLDSDFLAWYRLLSKCVHIFVFMLVLSVPMQLYM